MIDAPDSEPPFRLSKEKKTEKELHWCEKAGIYIQIAVWPQSEGSGSVRTRKTWCKIPSGWSVEVINLEFGSSDPQDRPDKKTWIEFAMFWTPNFL